MDKLLKLKQAREAAFAKAEAMVDKDGKFVAGADQKAWDAAMADVEKIDGEIKAAQEAIDAEASEAEAAKVRAERLVKARASTGPRTRVNAEGTATPNRVTAVVEGMRQLSEGDRRRGYQSLGHFAADVFAASAHGGGRVSDLLSPLAAASGMNQAIGSEGGFLVPPEFSQAIWDGLNGSPDSLLAMTDQYPVSGESLTFNANAETSRANGSRYGGVRAYWLAEAAQATATKPKFRQMKLEPHGLAALVYVTDKLLKNAGALTSYIAKAAAEEINFVVGDALINGNGSGQPLGVMKAGSLVTVSKETSQAANTILQANISKMWARLHPRCRDRAVWFYNVECEPQFDALNLPIKNVAGTENVGGISNVVWNAEKRLLKGRPVMPIEYCAALSSLGDIILADMGMYATGTQGGVESAVSMHLRFDYAEQAFRFMFYVDGQPWLADPLTPFKGSSTLSSFVTLQAR